MKVIEYLRSLIIVALLTLFSQTLLADVVGTVDGQFLVNYSGAATYTIPIKVPTGVGDVHPDLALTYSSQSGNGMLGMGWSLSGLSIITRCPKNFAQDPYAKGVQYDGTDMFCLDGQRLIQVEGSVYDSDGAVYQTEKDTLVRIQRVLNSGNDEFVVKTKSGLTLRYGTNLSESSKLPMPSAYNDASNTKIKVWAIGSIEDKQHNSVYFYYDTNAETGEQYPVAIKYSTYSLIAGQTYTITFGYESRNDKITGYSPGIAGGAPTGLPCNILKRINNITISYANGEIIKSYVIKYDETTDKLANRSTIRSIDECGPNNICTPATTFDWISSPTSLAKESWGITGTLYGGGYAWIYDIDGDGYSDIVTRTNTGIDVHKSTGIGFEPTSYTTDNVWGQAKYTWTGDFDGDGRQELLTVVPAGDCLYNNLTGTYSDGCQAHPEIYFYKNNLIDSQQWSFPTDYNWVTDGDRTWVGDFDGDGKTDIAYLHDNTMHFLRSTGVGFSPFIVGSDSQWGSSEFTWVGDFNGDGLSDIASASGTTVYVKLSNGLGFDKETWTVSAPWGIKNYTWVGDFNGDGLTDIATAGLSSNSTSIELSNVVYVNISTGAGFKREDRNIQKIETKVNPDETTTDIFWGDSTKTWVSDFNHDGKTDFATLLNGKLTYRLSSNDQFTDSSESFGNDWGAFYWTGDINGDGKIDIVSAGTQFISNYSSTGTQTLYVKLSDKTTPTSINHITPGLGQNIDIAYSQLTNSNVYAAANTQSVYPFDCTISPMTVVSSTMSDNGIGGKQSLSYTYKNSCSDMRGRGWLGFAETDSYDNVSKLKTVNSYYTGTRIDLYPMNGFDGDTYPYYGIAEWTGIYYTGNGTPVLLNSVLNQFDTKIITSPIGTKTYIPHVKTSYEHEYNTNGTEVSVTTSVSTIDDHGNATYLSKMIFKNASDSVITETNNTYNDDTSGDNWVLGRLQRSTVLTTLTDDSGTHTEARTTNYGYYPIDSSGVDTRGGMIAYTEEGSSDSEFGIARNLNLYVKTTYDYDQYGNKILVRKEGDQNADYPFDARESTSQYDYTKLPVDGTYTVTTTNALRQSGIKVIDSRWGSPLSITGPNGLTTTWKYDEFGRKIKEVRPDNTETVWEYHWCADSNTCPEWGVYYITTIVRVKDTLTNYIKAPVTIYFDKLGRELRSETKDINNLTVRNDTQYDLYGRVWRKSRNYFADSYPDYWTTYTYDVLGRTTKVVASDGSVETTEYSGSTKTVTQERKGENGYTVITASQTTNALGKVKWAKDPDGKLTYYTYDPFGELDTVSPPDNGGAILLMTYDDRGRKLSMDDPDMGHWEYAYDALGNLRWQKDAKGQEVLLYYDKLGRMVQRIDEKATPSDTSDDDIQEWCYDNRVNSDNTPSSCLADSSINTGNTRGKLLYTIDHTSGYNETYTYDGLGRPVLNITAFDSQTYTTSTTYDPVSGNVDTVTYPQSGGQGPFIKKNIYDNYGYGYLKAIVGFDQLSGNKKYWEVNNTNADGNITWETLGNNLTVLRGYDPATGWVRTISTGAGTNNNIQNLSYSYDSLGNLESRTDYNQTLLGSNGVTEHFRYDGLNRLTSVMRNNVTGTFYEYDSQGNIVYNSDVGYYSYGENGAGPHAVTSIERVSNNTGVLPGDANADKYINSLDIALTANQIIGKSNGVAGGKPDCDTTTGGINLHDIPCIARNITNTSSGKLSFQYDVNGNMLDGNDRAIAYTSFNKAEIIKRGARTLEFLYGTDRARYQQTIKDNGVLVSKTQYIGKLYERTEHADGKVEYKNFIYAGSRLVAINTRTSDTSTGTTTNTTNYIHQDHLGSTSVITDESGKAVERFAYSAFGMKIAAQWNDSLVYDPAATNVPVTNRSFTGHEELASVGLINMNGRVYDPMIGRFTSADPNVQFIHYSQSFNRYTYVENNPLSETDPSGFISIKEFEGNLADFGHKYGRTVAAIAVASVFPPGYAVLGGFVSGLVASNGDWKAGVVGAITAGAFNAAGSMAANGSFGSFAEFGKVLSHGIIGGVSSVMNGGKFRSGFFSAAITAAVSVKGGFGKAYNLSAMDRFVNAFEAAIVGGTASVIGGGKFADGAVTGAFSRMFNDSMHSLPRDSNSAIRSAGMKLSEMLNGADALANIRANYDIIEEQAFLFDVDPNLVRAIMFEEQTHMFPFEADLEDLGFGTTVGLGQVTVGFYGYSRSQLLTPQYNIRAISNHLYVVGNEPLISNHSAIASTATRYNCEVCTGISSYGRRAAYFYQRFSNGTYRSY